MNDETCPHGRELGLKCIFCGGTAKPSKRQAAKPATPPMPGPPPSAGARLPAKGLAHRPADPPRTGPLTKDAAAKALRRAEAVDRERARRPRKELAAAAPAAPTPQETEATRRQLGLLDKPPDLVPPSQVLARPAVMRFHFECGPVVAGHLEALLQTGFFGESMDRVVEILVLAGLRQNLELLKNKGGDAT